MKINFFFYPKDWKKIFNRNVQKWKELSFAWYNVSVCRSSKKIKYKKGKFFKKLNIYKFLVAMHDFNFIFRLVILSSSTDITFVTLKHFVFFFSNGNFISIHHSHILSTPWWSRLITSSCFRFKLNWLSHFSFSSFSHFVILNRKKKLILDDIK